MNPRILVAPNETNILEINFVIEGTSETPYEGGVYHGKLLFPKEYPLKPPVRCVVYGISTHSHSPLTARIPLLAQNIIILTPNGRFAPNRSLCVSRLSSGIVYHYALNFAHTKTRSCPLAFNVQVS